MTAPINVIGVAPTTSGTFTTIGNQPSGYWSATGATMTNAWGVCG
jgi:hypothetical protein